VLLRFRKFSALIDNDLPLSGLTSSTLTRSFAVSLSGFSTFAVPPLYFFIVSPLSSTSSPGS